KKYRYILTDFGKELGSVEVKVVTTSTTTPSGTTTSGATTGPKKFKPTINASPPKPILNKDGSSTKGSSTLTFDGGSDHPYVEVWVSVDGKDPTKLVEAKGNGRGTQEVTVQAGKKYRYILTDFGKELDSVEIRLSPTATSGTATPSKTNSGTTTGTTTT